MKALFTAAIMSVLLCVSQAHAISFSGVAGVFDDANDLLEFSGTIDNVAASSVPFTGIWFDYDPTSPFTSIINGGSLLYSSIGGNYSLSGSGISALLVDNVIGGSTSGPLSYHFIFSLPGAGAAFLDIIDHGVWHSGYGDQAQNVFTVTAGAVSVPTAVPLPASLPLLLLGIAGFGLLNRKRSNAS